jgi:hypothetical protein
MKCNQCEMLQISTGGMSLPCHEIGCPNTHKVWDKEEQEWVNPPRDDDYEDDYEWFDDDDEEQWDNQDEDAGGTGHGDMSYSDADSGL